MTQTTRQGADSGNERGARGSGLAREFLVFLREHKIWWLGPLVVVAILFVALMAISVTPVAPFIYQTR